jgi:hypothetical protein
MSAAKEFKALLQWVVLLLLFNGAVAAITGRQTDLSRRSIEALTSTNSCTIFFPPIAKPQFTWPAEECLRNAFDGDLTIQDNAKLATRSTTVLNSALFTSTSKTDETDTLFRPFVTSAAASGNDLPDEDLMGSK